MSHNDDDVWVMDISIAGLHPSSCFLLHQMEKFYEELEKCFPHLEKCCFSEGALAFTAPSSMNEADPGDAWIYQFGERTNLFLTHESESIFNAGNFFLQLLGSASTK